MANKHHKPSVDVYTKLLKFLEELRIVFDAAILGTPTGDVRNAFTELNIRRMEFIAKGNATALHSIRLHEVLDKIVESEKEIDEMSSDDSRLGDASYERDQLLEEMVKIMQE